MKTIFVIYDLFIKAEKHDDNKCKMQVSLLIET